mgnify:CR=1 FL=1
MKGKRKEKRKLKNKLKLVILFGAEFFTNPFKITKKSQQAGQSAKNAERNTCFSVRQRLIFFEKIFLKQKNFF